MRNPKTEVAMHTVEPNPDTKGNLLNWGLETKSSPGSDHFLVLHEFPNASIEARWREFLSHADEPAHYDTPEYFLEPFWAGRNPFAVLAFHEEKIVGVMTGIHTGESVTCGLKSRPQVCIREGNSTFEASRTLMDGLLQEAGSATVINVFGWGSTPLNDFEQRGFHKFELQGDVVLDLSVGRDALFKGMSREARRNVRAASKHGVEAVEAVTERDLEAWWDVYLAWRDTKRKRIHVAATAAHFQALRKVRQNRRHFLARYDGNVIAASVIRFCPGGLAEYSSNCSREEFLHLYPNDLLLWRTLEWASERGLRKYSLGGADHFHRKFGGRVVPICRYFLDRSFLQWHYQKEKVEKFTRELSHHLPPSVRNALRRTAA
jgi:hypothetical protein